MFSSSNISNKISLAIVNDQIRARCWVCFDSNEDPFDFPCKIDTGASKTVIPQSCWEQFKDRLDIDFSHTENLFSSGVPMLAHRVKLAVMVSGKDSICPIDLGQCELFLAYDRQRALVHNSSIDGSGTQAQELKVVLLGLGGGSMDNGGLCIDWKEKTAYLVRSR